MPQQIDHLARSHFLGIEQVVDAHVDEHLLVVGFEVFVVIDPRDRLAGAKLFGQHGRDDINRLFGTHRDEKIGLAHRRFFQYGKSRAVTLDGNYVGHSRDLFDPFRVVVDHGNIVRSAAEHFRQVGSHLPYSRYDYPHE